MDRSLTAALLRPRHLVASALVFLLLGGLGGMAVGVARASGPDDGSGSAAIRVDSFTLAQPRAGDRGVYDVRSAANRTIDHEYGDTWTRRLGFEWLGDEVVRNSARTAEWANLVSLNETRIVGQGELDTDERIHAIRPGTLDAFAYLAFANTTRVDDEVHTHSVTANTGFQERPGQLPCGFRNPFQGVSTEVPSPAVQVPVRCDQASGIRDDERRVLRLREATVQDGVAFVRADAVDEGGRWTDTRPVTTYLFREDIPYPLQIREGGRDAVFVLVQFERGDGPILRSEPQVVAGPPPPLQFRPRLEWGPDESGVEHPFPFSAAYQQARDDPTYPGLRDFLASHPGAYVQRAGYQSFAVDSTRESPYHRWYFTVTDASEELSVDVIRREGATPGPLPLHTPLPTPAYDISDRGVEPVQTSYPLPGSLRAELPTVASMLRQWEAYRSPAYAGVAGNSWSMYLRCTYDWNTSQDDCSRAATHIGAGWTQYDRTYAGPMPWPLDRSQPVDSQRTSSLGWSEWPGRDDLTFDHPSSYYESRQVTRRDGSMPSVAEGPSFSPHSSSLFPLAVAGLWVFPSSEESAAIGLGAVLAGLLYWLKPLAKAGLGLFSRVEPEELLANPTRAELVAAVEANPGIHHQELVRIARKGNGAAEHHLQKLVAGGLLSRHKSAGYTCYFRAGKVDRRVMASAHLLKSPVARAIVEAAQRQPGTSLAQVARDAGVSVPTVHYHAKRLQAAGLVRWEGGLYPGAQGGPVAAPVSA